MSTIRAIETAQSRRPIDVNYMGHGDHTKLSHDGWVRTIWALKTTQSSHFRDVNYMSLEDRTKLPLSG